MPAVPFKKTGTAPEDAARSWIADIESKIAGAVGENSAETVQRDVANALTRLEQSDIPESEMKAVFDHLAGHYAQLGKDAPTWEHFTRRVASRHRAHPALPLGVTRATVMASRRQGQPNDHDLALINQKARSPLQSSQVYVIPMQNSDNSIDSYFTRMTPLTLNNYAADATRGVAFCDSHQHYQMPIGRSFMGDVTTQGTVIQANTLAYMLRGMTLPGGMRSDDYIQGMEGGIYNDVSVGFDPQHYWCSVCNLDMLNDWDCNHYPGRVYDTKTGDVQCIADVDAHLIENSLVYKGANDNAMILPNGSDADADSGRAFSNPLLLKTEVEIERGRATARDLRYVEDRCHVRLFQRYPGYQPKKQDDDMKGSEFVRGIIDSFTRDGKEISSENMGRLEAIHTDLQAGHNTMADAMRAMADFMSEKDHDVSADPDNDGDIDTGPQGTTDDPDGKANDHPGDSGVYGTGASSGGRAVTPPEIVAPSVPVTSLPDTERMTETERAAVKFAEQMRGEAIEDALKSGVRAMGDKFNEDRYRAMLARFDYEQIRGMQQDWDHLAAERLSSRGAWDDNARRWSTEPTMRGGRQTAPRDPNDPVGLRDVTAKSGRSKVQSNLFKG